jgi:hypothetical protein
MPVTPATRNRTAHDLVIAVDNIILFKILITSLRGAAG